MTEAERIAALEREMQALKEERADLHVRLASLERVTQPRLVYRPEKHRRGRSPVARVLAGGSLRAKGLGWFTHDQICDRMRTQRSGLATLGYSLVLAIVASSSKDRQTTNAAFVMGERTEWILNREGSLRPKRDQDTRAMFEASVRREKDKLVAWWQWTVVLFYEITWAHPEQYKRYCDAVRNQKGVL